MKRRSLIKSLGLSPWVGAPWVHAQAEVPVPAIGANVALPDVPLFDGSPFRAADAQGQVVLVYWWASWCPFCAEQSPLMQKLWDAQRTRGLKMLGLSIDRDAGAARRYMAQRGYTFPTGMATPDTERVLPRPSKALPMTLVRGRDGRVVMAEKGQLFPEDVEQIARFV
ncbi:MAG: TlpA family protein disulfide reductase [Hydrogenophaga sp.]|nr:TlpA family protein disulfide reductase [Hydrogenophaga sp.]